MYAAEDKNKPIAIVVPVEAALKSLAKQNGINEDSLEALADHKKLRSMALKEIQGVGRSGGLVGIEIIDGVVLAKEEWTPQNVRTVRKSRAKEDRTDFKTGSGHQRDESQPEGHPSEVQKRRGRGARQLT